MLFNHMSFNQIFASVALVIASGSAIAATPANTARTNPSSLTQASSEISYDGWEFINDEWRPVDHKWVIENGRMVHADSHPTTSASVQAPQDSKSQDLIAPDGAVFRNGEWQLPTHAYDIVGGRLVHVDSLPHSIQRESSTITTAERRRAAELYNR
jgi:hypothetical protein